MSGDGKECQPKDEQRRHSIYEQLRAHLEHEDTLVHQRLTWLLTSQSFLFAATALIFINIKYNNIVVGGILITTIAIIGFLICYVVGGAVRAAYNSIRILRIVWRANFDVPEEKTSRASELFAEYLAEINDCEENEHLSDPTQGKFWKLRKFILGLPEPDMYAIGGVSPKFGRYPYLTGSGHPLAGDLGATGAQAIPRILMAGWVVVLVGGFVGLGFSDLQLGAAPAAAPVVTNEDALAASTLDPP